ncbi:hypothetical protein PUN28_010652 [Cardiocondyla obscurior]
MEPGTSLTSTPSTSSSSSVPVSERITNIKVEPGLHTTTQRLTSFRLPRDLTLGGSIKSDKPKKVYTPNFNVQRNKKKDVPATLARPEPPKVKSSDRGRERGRGRGRGDRGNIIESVGIWSEGMYTTPTVKKSDGYRASSSTNTTKNSQKSKLDITKITDKIEAEKRLKTLLGEDVLYDDPDANEKMYPLTLPRVKKDIYDLIDEKIDKKPIISENGEIMNTEKVIKNNKEELTIPQIIENKMNAYTLIQFPESLPGLEFSTDIAGSKSNDTTTVTESDSKAKTERCTLNGLRNGLLGKLEILKSGRTRLRLGEMSFFVDIGTQQRFQQDLLAVKIDTASQTGSLINLGPVPNKLICSPDFESMLKNS